MTKVKVASPHTAWLLLVGTACRLNLAKPAGQAQDIDSLTLATSAGPITAPVTLVAGSSVSVYATAKLSPIRICPDTGCGPLGGPITYAWSSSDPTIATVTPRAETLQCPEVNGNLVCDRGTGTMQGIAHGTTTIAVTATTTNL